MLGRREWVWWATTDGAGDCGRDEDAEALFGGPCAQADFCGSWGGFFDAVPDEDLLIEFCKETRDIFSPEDLTISVA